MATNDVDDVVLLDLGYKPEAAVSGAVLVQTEHSTFLTFNAMKLENDGLRHPAGHAVIEFLLCAITKFGYPNDEASPGHPLYSKMAGAYDIYEVLNSSWIAELDQQNLVAFPNADNGARSRHFIISFHDSTFECIADDFKLVVTDEPYEVVFQRIADRVVAE